MLVDSHAHIDARVYEKDRDKVVARAEEAGVRFIINASSDLESSRASLKLAQQYAGVFVALGFHPHNAARMGDGDLDIMTQLSQEPKVVAIGEIGLDFYRNLSPREAQIEAFKRQLELAETLGLPVIIHSRNADEEVFAILAEWAGRQKSQHLGVLHCFSGNKKLAERYIALGFFISIAGPVTYPSSNAAQIVSDIPLDRLLIETDCPYLAPLPYRGKRNEPAYVSFVADKIGQIRGLSPGVVAENTAQNAVRLFRLPVQAR